MSASRLVQVRSSFAEWNRISVWNLWGDDIGSQVFVETLYKGMRDIFRYSNNPTRKRSLQSRIVACCHKHQAVDAAETFVDMNDCREAILESIVRCWNSCSSHPCLRCPDVVIEIYQDESGRLKWQLSHLSSYEDYLQQLRPLDQVLPEAFAMNITTVDLAQLLYYGGFEGRGNNKLVSLRSHPSTRWVFKGLDLVKYLRTGSAFQSRRDACYREIRTILEIPSYPNIISTYRGLYVTASMIPPEPGHLFICGALYPYMKDGTLKYQINKATKVNIRLQLEDKAKWCFQMASAIAYTHYQAHKYHMDIRPSKFLINDKRDIILIDWEQSGASRCTIAPEADGSYDAELQRGELQAKLIYKLYEGPERENNPSSWPRWNIFAIWRDECPRALEAAEVFSLGRTMWMLLAQVDEGDPQREIAVFWEKAYDIPSPWVAIVQQCIDKDPNQRPGLVELRDFWQAETRHDLPNPIVS